MKALLIVALACAAGLVEAEVKRVPLRVVDVAGGVAYIQPGEQAGLRVGQKVRFGKRRFRLKAVTQENATVALGKRALRVGARGSGRVQRERTHGPKGLAPPLPLSAYRGAWPDAVLPADQQSPALIPIGSIRVGGPVDVVLIAQSRTLLPADQGHHMTRASLRAQIRAEPFGDRPFGIDADAMVSRWFGARVDDDLGRGSRPLVSVQELRLRYGDRDRPMVGLGRLRYAASGVGMLDGVRVSSPSFSGITATAFGGVAPNNLDGVPASDVARFGAQLSYARPDLSSRPTFDLTAYGSVFDGSVDERRLAAEARFFPGRVSIGGYLEASIFDSDNEWGANRVELTAAGIDGGFGVGPWRTALTLNAQQPERSRWLASLLPPSWFCSADEAAAGPEPCDGSRNMRYSSLLTVGRDSKHLALRVGGTAVFATALESDQLAGFVDVHLLELLWKASVEVGSLISRAQFLDTYAVRVGVATPILDDLDASVFYRPALLSYEAAVENLLEHRAGAEFFYRPLRALTLRVAAEGTRGNDITMLGLFGTAIWRTGF